MSKELKRKPCRAGEGTEGLDCWGRGKLQRMLHSPWEGKYPNSVDATIVRNHGQVQLRFPLLFILFIFLFIIITAL